MARVSKVLSLSLPPEMSKQTEEIAREESRTKSELVREALRHYIARRRWEKIRAWGEMATKRSDGTVSEEQAAEMVREARKERSGRRQGGS